MNEADLQSLVRDALASRDRVAAPPTFAASWRAAVAASESRRAPAATWFARLAPLAVVAAIASIVLAVVWQFTGVGSGPAPWTEAADLQLARELAPARQWPSTTDSLLQAYQYAPPSDNVIPNVKHPFEESFL